MKDDHKYDDIIDLPHHVSSRHAPMSMIDRGAQFSPFAALVGYDAAIRETARLTDSPIELADSGKAMVDEKLRMLLDMDGAQITVTYFRPDDRKSGGAYVTHTGNVKKVDKYTGAIIMADGFRIPFDRIIDMEV